MLVLLWAVEPSAAVKRRHQYPPREPQTPATPIKQGPEYSGQDAPCQLNANVSLPSSELKIRHVKPR